MIDDKHEELNRKSKICGFKGVWIPSSLFDNKDLNNTEVVLVSVIDSFTNENNPCFASNELLAERSRLSVRNLTNLLSDLTRRGFLIRVFYDGRHMYRVVNPLFSSDPMIAQKWINHFSVKDDSIKKLKQFRVKDVNRFKEKQETDLTKNRKRTSQKTGNVKPLIYKENKEENKEEKEPPIIPQGGSGNGEELFLFPENENEEVTEKEKSKPSNKLSRELEELRLRVCKWFNRRPGTSWTPKEIKGLRDFMRDSTPEEKDILEKFYSVKEEGKYLRQAPLQLFNYWPGEVDKANNWESKPTSNQKSEPKPPEKTILSGTFLDEEYWRRADGTVAMQREVKNFPNGDQMTRKEPEFYLRYGDVTREQFDFYAAKYPERVGTGNYSPEKLAREAAEKEEKRKSEQKQKNGQQS